MLNQIVIIGRLVDKPEVKKSEGGKQYSNITIAVPRSYKNKEGEYDTDFIDVTLWESISENTAQYCDKGDLLGVKGRLETGSYDKEDGTTKYYTKVVAEKVTFLSSKHDKEE